MKSAFVRVTALVLSALFLTAAAAAAIELWRAGGDLLGNPKLKIAAGWLASGAIFLAIGLRGWRQRRRNATDELKARQ